MSIRKQLLGRRWLWFLLVFVPLHFVAAQNSPLQKWAAAPALAGAKEDDTRAAFATDGKRVAFVIGSRLWVHSVTDSSALGAPLYASLPTQKVLSFVWMSQRILVSRQVGQKAETVSVALAAKTSKTVAFPRGSGEFALGCCQRAVGSRARSERGQRRYANRDAF